MSLYYDTENHLVITVASGIVGMNETMNMINNAVILGEKHNCYRLLFDMREVEEVFSFIEEYNLAKSLTQKTTVTLQHRCAIIYASPKNKMNYDVTIKETIAFNWGQTVFKVFLDMEEGREWLLSLSDI